jgi:hypothetical protein
MKLSNVIQHLFSDIDDGTGVITAAHFIKKRIALQNSNGFPATLKSLENSASYNNRLATQATPQMSSLFTKTKNVVMKSRSSFEIGTCVEAKGCIQHFQGRPQLLAFSVRELENPNQEMKRYIRLEHLKRNVYSKDILLQV